MKKKTVLIFLYALASFLFICSPVFAIPKFPSKVSGHIVMKFDLSKHARNKEVRLWIPYPISSPYQTITNIHVTGNYNECGVYTDKKYQDPILYARWAPGAKSRKLTLSFDVVRIQVVKKDFPKKEPCWNPGDYKMWLSPWSLGPIDGKVKQLAEKITKGQTTVLGKARAIYDWICENMFRDPKVRGCGMGNVLFLLNYRGGKCTDIHSVFVALCRAVGVPAREIFGIRMGRKGKKTDITKWEHCWAEFFLPGYGWVPVDPADVTKMMLKHHLTLKDKETKQWRRYFWGAWDPYRIKLSIGRDIILNPRQHGRPLNNFGYPYAEVGGQPLDWFNPSSFKYSFTYLKK